MKGTAGYWNFHKNKGHRLCLECCLILAFAFGSSLDTHQEAVVNIAKNTRMAIQLDLQFIVVSLVSFVVICCCRWSTATEVVLCKRQISLWWYFLCRLLRINVT